jgi:hypothetical protein
MSRVTHHFLRTRERVARSARDIAASGLFTLPPGLRMLQAKFSDNAEVTRNPETIAELVQGNANVRCPAALSGRRPGRNIFPKLTLVGQETPTTQNLSKPDCCRLVKKWSNPFLPHFVFRSYLWESSGLGVFTQNWRAARFRRFRARSVRSGTRERVNESGRAGIGTPRFLPLRAEAYTIRRA